MPDTPTTRLGLRRQSVGANRNTWGLHGNEGMDAIDQAVAGVVTVPLASSTYTLQYQDFQPCEARNAVLRVIGSVGDAVITVPARPKTWVVFNDLSAGGSLTFVTATQSAGSGATIPAGAVGVVVCEVNTAGVAACVLGSPSAFGGRRLQAVGEPVAPDDAAPAGWVENLIGLAVFGSAQAVPQGVVDVETDETGAATVYLDLDTGYSFQHIVLHDTTTLQLVGSVPLDGDMIIALDLFAGASTALTYPPGTEFPGGTPPALSVGWDSLMFRLTRGRILCLAKTGFGAPAP